MRERFWSLVAAQIVPIVTVTAGLIVAVLQYINPPWFKNDYTLTAILGLLVLIATSELVERARSLTKIESRLEAGFRDVLIALDTNDVEVLKGVDQIYEFWSDEITRLTETYDSINMNPIYPVPVSVPNFRRKAAKAAKKSRIRRRYIVVFHDLQTLERIEQHLKEYPEGTFFVGFFEPGSVPFPMITFAIGDKKMVTYGGYYGPHESPGIAMNVLTRHPETVALFSSYFESLWQKSIKLNPGYVRTDLLAAIRERLESR